MRKTSSPLRAVRIDRSSPATAEGVIETLLARSPKAGRRAVLQFLAESIASVSTTSNDRWGVTLDPGHVRFNTGQTESVVFWPDQVDVLVKDIQSVSGMALRGPYPSAGGSRLLGVPYDIAVRVLPRIRAAHTSAVASAIRRPSTRLIKGAHSPGVVEYLWRTLGLDGSPPVPTYFVGRRTLAGSRGSRHSEEAVRVVMALPDLDRSETMAVIKVRLAQQLFRRRLASSRRRCCLTGITDPAHLRASHIKPWSECTERERQDPNNGLLLAPHVDHLFDRGYLSFEDDGTVLVSKHLDRAVLEAWGLDAVTNVAPFSTAQAKYLKYHRNVVFKDA